MKGMKSRTGHSFELECEEGKSLLHTPHRGVIELTIHGQRIAYTIHDRQ